VIARIHRLKALTVNVKAGNAVRNYKAVKSSNPDDLVFQSVKEGKPMRVEGQMRHSRISTTMDIYAQIVPAAQSQAIAKLSEFVNDSVPKSFPTLVQ
jgi:hypothetical protein